MSTTRFESLPLNTADVLETWIEQNNLSESTRVIQGVTHDDYLITLDHKPTVSALTIDGQDLDLTDYLILEHVYDAEGFFGQRFAYRLTLTDDSQLAEDFLLVSNGYRCSGSKHGNPLQELQRPNLKGRVSR